MEHSAIPQRFSRVLHLLSGTAERASTAVIVALILLVFLVVSIVYGFPGKWQIVFSSFASSITLVMVFVIQHAQSRQQVALQLKLDELIRASPEADDHLVHIEQAQESELIEREESQMAHHESLREANRDGDGS